MPNRSLTIALLILAVFTGFTYAPLLTSPAGSWREMSLLLAHACVAIILCVVLSRRIGLKAAFTGALLFSVFPGHAFIWGIHAGPAALIAYAAVLGAAAAIAYGFERVHRFLTTQEMVVRYIFLAAVAALMAAFITLTLQVTAAWSSEESLWRWRAAHGGGSSAINALVKVLERRNYRDDPALMTEIAGLYSQSLKNNPDQPDIYVRFGEFYEGLGKAGEATDIYIDAIHQIPADPEAYVRLAAIYERHGQPERVIELFNDLLKIHPEDDQICLRVLTAYNAAVSRHPDGSIYQEKREEVLAQYEQLSKRKQYTANDYFNLGLLYEQVGGFEEAMRFYRKALELQPNHEKSLLNLASRYQATGDFKAALALYERLVRFYPKSSEGYLKLGTLFNALGDADKARYFYQKLISVDSGNAEAYFNLGYLNESAGELREALSDYEKAIDRNPQHAEAYYNMGNVYAALAQYPEAIASYLRTVAINPTHQNAYVNLSILSFKSRDFAGAIRYLEEAERLGYAPPEAYLKTLEPYRKK